MTLDEYAGAVKDRLKVEWSERFGQASFNVLYINRPDLSEQIRATDLDPFYSQDPRTIITFYAWLVENWSTSESG